MPRLPGRRLELVMSPNRYVVESLRRPPDPWMEPDARAIFHNLGGYPGYDKFDGEACTLIRKFKGEPNWGWIVKFDSAPQLEGEQALNGELSHMYELPVYLDLREALEERQ